MSAWLAFLVASVALILVPGVGQALVIANTLAEGRRAGVLTAVGLNVGTLFHAAAAACGLSAILATSATAFAVVKYLGAAYLIYLGLRALGSGAAVPGVPAAAAGAAFRRAVATGVLNPKVAIFFLAFLPQFVDPARGWVFAQFLVLGATIAVLDVLYNAALVLFVGRLRRGWLGDARIARWQGRLCGAVLVGLGLRLAAQER